MPRKVAFFVGTLQTGGIERSVTDWCIYLKKEGSWQPTVICLNKKSGPFLNVLESNGISVFQCRVHDAGFVLRLRRLLLELKPEVVHSQVAFSMPWQVCGVRLAGVKKIIFTQQNEYQNWGPSIAKFRIRLYFLLFFPFIHHYTCVSERVRNSLSELVSIRKDRLLVIPNGVNTDVFGPSLERKLIKRTALGVGEGTFLIGMIARFSPQKGHSFLVEGIRKLKMLRGDFKVMLVGTGELQEKIASLIQESGLEDTFILSGRSTDVEIVIPALDCFILPSLWEGMPLALLEAMACGVPVIGTDVAGTREVVKNGENGLLIPAKDPEAIAAALNRLLNDHVLRHNLSAAGIQCVRELYSVSSNVQKYMILYED